MLEQEVHVWHIPLDNFKDLERELLINLSPDEQERASRYRFDIDRQSFIRARSSLRILLSNYLSILPAEIKFSYSPNGKPLVSHHMPLQFNLSHSHELAICAFTLNAAIGIDVEYKRSMDRVLQLAKRFFSSEEFEILRSLSSQQQHDLFFQIWTLKEAYLKATGDGLAKLGEVQTKWTGESFPKLVFSQGQLNWMTHQFQPQVNYTASLVVGNTKRIVFKTMETIVPRAARHNRHTT